MTQTKYLIIGGGIAGTNAAHTLRQKDPEASITLVTDEKERLYSRVLLPQYLRDTVSYEGLFLKKPDFYTQEKINFLTQTKVTDLDDKAQIATTSKGVIHYEKLLLACGIRLIPWEVPGYEKKGVVYLRTIEDSVDIRKLMDIAKEAVVVGGGFIALELLSSFIKKGLKTTLIVRENSFFVRFLEGDGGHLVEDIIREQGANIILEDEVSQVTGESSVEGVVTKRGQQISAQIVGVGIGVAPKLGFLDNTQVVRSPFIETNKYLETTSPNVWAAGDVTFFEDIMTSRHHNIGNWANAADQGKIAGLNMSGDKTEFVSTSSYSIPFFTSSIAVLGDPNKNYATEVIIRGSRDQKALGEIYFKDDFILGATLVGLPIDRGPLQNLIKNQVRIKDKDKLKSLDFSIGGLLSG